ncbi:hypothetical protein P376_3563 [Streptomyces sp. HCCB10043]|nr:hypothetical protein P376_3563 [Streptomyces sp. HCCB10043]
MAVVHGCGGGGPGRGGGGVCCAHAQPPESSYERPVLREAVRGVGTGRVRARPRTGGRRLHHTCTLSNFAHCARISRPGDAPEG